MKNLKTKIGLSVLALACLGAGTLTLQNNAFAKAEETDGKVNKSLTMDAGADICVSEEFSGIRWKTNFPKYSGSDNAQYGVLVAPTGKFGAYLTHEDLGTDENPGIAIDLAFVQGTIQANKGAGSYYSVINYETLADVYKKDAYALELTARAYVYVNEEYQYSDMAVDTSRSAKAIAINAELDGTLDKLRASEDTTKQAQAAKALEYYGGTAENLPTFRKGVSDFITGAHVINKENISETNTIDMGTSLEGYDDILFGTTRLNNPVISGNTLQVTSLDNVKEGEYYVTVFNKDGSIVVKPVIYATKVLTKASELAMFNVKGDRYDKTAKISNWTKDEDGNVVYAGYENQVCSGYYVLGKTIDATDYVHGSRNATTGEQLKDVSVTVDEEGKNKDINGDKTIKNYKETRSGTYADVYDEFNDSSWNGAASYTDKAIGLTGTFNGMGYTITNMTIASQREGFFGIVNNGTVKNVGFTGVKSVGQKYAYVLANYLIGATIENVYIAPYENGFKLTDGTALVASTAYKNTKITNCYIRFEKQSTAAVGGALFGSTHSSQEYTCENVFVNSRTHYKYYVPTTTTTEDGESITTYAADTVSYFVPMTYVSQATRQKDTNGNYTIIKAKGEIYLAQNQTHAEITEEAYKIHRIEGVFWYKQGAENDTPNPWKSHDWSDFIATGCWKSGTRGVAWIVK